MAKKNLNITLDFVNQCTETINEFGAVRMESLLKYIELTLGVTDVTATKVLDAMKDRRDVYVVKYADMHIIKTTDKHKAVYRYLDAFDAYLCLFEEAIESEKKDSVYPNKASFPRDFTFYDTRGYLYSVYMYDNNIMQKIGMQEKRKDKYIKGATLIIFSAGTNLKSAALPELKDPYRYAVVRKSKSGNYACEISELQGETK